MVNIPPSESDLIDTLIENSVDILVERRQSEEGLFFRAISSLFFPILLLAGLFLRQAMNRELNRSDVLSIRAYP